MWAHWHYYPLAMGNGDARTDYYENAWIKPDGEGGKHKPYGGFMRERPLPRLPRPASAAGNQIPAYTENDLLSGVFVQAGSTKTCCKTCAWRLKSALTASS